MESMKAVIWNGDSVPVCRNVNKPVAGKGEVLLKVLRAGICGSDLSILSGLHPRAKAPLVLGHEIAARVEALGPGIAEDSGKGLSPGSLVTLEPILSCGECVACKGGFPHVCSSLKLYGIDVPGGMAEYMVVSADKTVPARNGMDPDLVVLAEPLAVAVHAVRHSGLRYGDFACVLGGGPIGLLVALVAGRATPRDVIVSEPKESRRSIADFMRIRCVDPTSESIEDVVSRETGGRGADVCFETSGSQAAIDSSTKVLRPRGTLVQVSMPKDKRYFNIVDLTFKELHVRGIRVYEDSDFEKALDFLCGYPDLFQRFLSRPYSLDEASEAFSEAVSGDGGMRIVFRIDD